MKSWGVVLPTIELHDLTETASIAPQEQATAARRIPRIEWVARSGSVLHASSLGDAEAVLSLNLARGCVHQCGFCSSRAYPSGPGDAVVYAYRDTVERLEEELQRRRRLPKAVFVSAATDPFPPTKDLQSLALRVVGTLAEHGVDAWLMTRGYIRPAARQYLATHREHVRLTVCITTLHRSL